MMTLVGGLLSVLLVYLNCTEYITLHVLLTLLPIPIGVILDILIVGILYWYNEIRVRAYDE